MLETETIVGSFKHEELAYRKLCGYQSIAMAEGTVPKLECPRITPRATELTSSRALPLRSQLKIRQEKEPLPLPTERNTQEARKCVPGAAVQE